MNEILLVEKFNKFIKNWCGNNYRHLIDSDQNDAEEFRDLLRFVDKELGRLLVEKTILKKHRGHN